MQLKKPNLSHSYCILKIINASNVIKFYFLLTVFERQARKKFVNPENLKLVMQIEVLFRSLNKNNFLFKTSRIRNFCESKSKIRQLDELS